MILTSAFLAGNFEFGGFLTSWNESEKAILVIREIHGPLCLLLKLHDGEIGQLFCRQSLIMETLTCVNNFLCTVLIFKRSNVTERNRRRKQKHTGKLPSKGVGGLGEGVVAAWRLLGKILLAQYP
jgi:hypothetical protein